MILEIVVADRVDEDEFLHTFGIVESKRRRDRTAVRASEHRRAANAKAIHKTRDHPRLRSYRVVEPLRLVRVTETEEIDRYDMEPGVREHGSRGFPDVHGCGVAVDQKNCRLGHVAELLVMNTRSIYTYEIGILGVRDQGRHVV